MSYAQSVIDLVTKKDPGQPEFHQAVTEVLESLQPCLDRYPKYEQNKILERIVEPERQLMFRVPWIDDKGRSRSTAAIASSSTALSAPTRAACACTRA